MAAPNPRPHWSLVTKITVSLLLLAFGVFLLFTFRQLLAPLILAIVLAYILSPLARRLQTNLGISKILAIFLAFLIFIIIAFAIPAILIPYLTAQFGSISLDLDLLVRTLEASLATTQYEIVGFRIDVATMLEQAVGSLQQLIQPAIGQTLTLAAQIVTSLVWMVFIFVVSFYLIKDSDKFSIWVDSHIPPDYRGDYVLLRTEINEIWSAFFRGQLVLATVVAIIFAFFGLVIGLPFALAMSLLAGLLEFLPSIGHTIWLTLAIIISLLLGSTWLPMPNWAFTLLVVGLHVVFQQFDLNYLIPRIIGRSVRLPPLIVILGTVAAAVSVGVLGIPLAAPTIASARVIGRYIYSQLFDLDPFMPLESAATPLPPPDPQWWRKLDPRAQNREETESR
ncbi:MAG: AI-2E family transporter [Anaerolineales bacterium]|jgi:predicted PurR-regulated permease PerM